MSPVATMHDSCSPPACMQVTGLKKTELMRGPSPPYMTTSMLADAGNQLGASVGATMMDAQALFEGGDQGTTPPCFCCCNDNVLLDKGQK